MWTRAVHSPDRAITYIWVTYAALQNNQKGIILLFIHPSLIICAGQHQVAQGPVVGDYWCREWMAKIWMELFLLFID